MRNLYIIGIFICLTVECNPQSGWFQLNSGVSYNIEDVFFVNENTGFAACFTYPGVILKTTNGGTNWSAFQFQSNYSFKSIYFLNETTGFISGIYYNVFKTTNCGINWINLSAFIPGSLESIQFLNPQTGYIAAANPKNAYVYKTTNSGINWVNVLTYFGTIGFFDIEILDSNIIVEAGGPCSRTTNGGINWNYLSFWGTGVSFSDVSIGYITKHTNGIAKTTDRGATWINQQSPVNTQLNAVDASSSNMATACGHYGVIVRTLNGGTNWIIQTSPVTEKLNSVFFINDNTGWIAGDNGVILKTTTGGITPLTQLSKKIPEGFTLYQNYPNPFNPTTKIKFSIPLTPQSPLEGGKKRVRGRSAGFVTLTVYDVLGREVASLVNEQLQPGTYEVEFDGSNYPSGVYYYKFITSSFIETKKMILIK